MANYATLKAAIEAAIYENHNNEIDGQILQETLLAIVNSLGTGYQFIGAATPSTNPGTPDYNVAYLANPGTYPNFGNLVVPDRHLGILKYNGTWVLEIVETTESLYNEIFPITVTDAEFPDDPTSPLYNKRITWGGTDGNWGGYVGYTNYGYVTDFIPLDGIKTIEYNLKSVSLDTAVVAFFTAAKGPVYIGTNPNRHIAGVRGTNGAQTGTVDASEFPATAAYVRFSSRYDYAATSAKLMTDRGSIFALTEDFEPVRESVEGTEYQPAIGDGTSNNGSNAYAIRSNTPIYATKGDTVIVDFKRPLADGESYRYVFVGASSDIYFTDLGGRGVRTETTIDSGIVSNKYIVKSDATICINVSVYLKDASGVTQTLRPASNFSKGDLVVTVQKAAGVAGRVSEQESPQGYNRNRERAISLNAACRYRKGSETSKDFQALIVTDSHDDVFAVLNAVDMLNGFETIDAMFHLGDMAGAYMGVADNMPEFISAEKTAKKPFYNVIGNHEAGTFNMVGLVPSKEHLYDVLIAPMVELGYLEAGEYTENKCYYYHDFAAHNIRLIVINEFDGPLTLDTEYWTPVAYDSSATLIAFNHTYSPGDVVRIRNYTDYCFQCVKTATTGTSETRLSGEEPKYNPAPKFRMISQAQANWFLNTLLTTPANYKVVVAMHQVFSGNAVTDPNKKFCQNINLVGANAMSNYLTVDFFANAIDAFIRGVSYSETVTHDISDPAYTYNVAANFANKNTGAGFLCYLGGHSHRDLIWRHQTYTNQWMVAPVCTNTNSYAQAEASDIRRTRVDGIDYDCLTAIAFNRDARTISLTKLGANITDEMTARDFEKIGLSL